MERDDVKIEGTVFIYYAVTQEEGPFALFIYGCLCVDP